MSPTVRLAPQKRRLVLAQLSRDRLAEVAARLELEVSDRRSIEAHVDAIVRKRSLDFRLVLELLQREELKAACEALGLDASGRENARLIERMLGGQPEASNDTTHQHAANESSVPPPGSARSLGTEKSALRRFVLDVAGGYRGRDAAATFTSRLLQCFGWAAEGPPGTTLPTTLEVVDHAQRATRDVALLWRERRVLVDVVKHDMMLDYAWKELLRVCLQIAPAPQYVVLTNQRDLHLYDLGRNREQPRLSIPVEELPKYSEAFPFLSTQWVPGTTPKIVDVSKVSREVADLVARLYRSLKDQHPKRERDVVQFTLQCILTMFAEDIGLLPKQHFSSLLYEGARHRDVEVRLRELFEIMSTRDVPAPRVVPYFNGGLFTNAVTLRLGDAQLQALIKASEANWTYVDPHIFGSVFQGIMNASERHKHGVHYTAHDDIMRVVGPTIVDPWRKRIRGAKSLTELLEVRAGLFQFRVLDPACGSGNFLYVAFRELYRLDTELLARLREFPSTQTDGRARLSWGAGIQTSNFFGMDINSFAVELAKVTLNIAKKIAFEERREFAATFAVQTELDIDPSLPLDNLDENVICADALFADWPAVDAIVGNPPYLGGLKIRSRHGEKYLRQLQEKYPGVGGRADYCVYWFRRAHERVLSGGRVGLVATNSVREGPTKEAALDFIVAHGGTITNAVSSREWPGDATLHVSMVNWTKGPTEGPQTLIVEDQVYELAVIPTHLQLHTDVHEAKEIRANKPRLTTTGVQWGTKSFEIDGATARELRNDPKSRPFIRPVAHGITILTRRLADDVDYVIDLSTCPDEASARATGAAWRYLKANVHGEVMRKAATFEGWEAIWWQHWRPRREFFQQIGEKARFIACSRHAARPIFFFLSTKFVPNDSMQVFGFNDDYTYGVLQSTLHWSWVGAKGTKLEERARYTAKVWSSFPWPQEPSEREVEAVAAAARELRRVRTSLMLANRWSLRALHQAAEVTGPHPLNDAQAALDEAVRRAYAMPDGQGVLEFLRDLNVALAEDELAGLPVVGPGLPAALPPSDPRWVSADCIEPPRMEGE